MTKQLLIAEFLRVQAGRRLAAAASDPIRSARSAAALLDAAAYAAGLMDDDSDLVALDRGGCFRGDVFDPGGQGVAITRSWQFVDQPFAWPRDLLAALAAVAAITGPAALQDHRDVAPQAPGMMPG